MKGTGGFHFLHRVSENQREPGSAESGPHRSVISDPQFLSFEHCSPRSFAIIHLMRMRLLAQICVRARPSAEQIRED